jgi:phage terminase large subunit GpA-like protein
MTHALAGAFAPLRPPPLLTVSQWADAHRMLGKTECGLNWMCYVFHHQPAPLLMVQPTLEMAELYAEQRFAPLLRSTPELAALTGEAVGSKPSTIGSAERVMVDLMGEPGDDDTADGDA